MIGHLRAHTTQHPEDQSVLPWQERKWPQQLICTIQVTLDSNEIVLQFCEFMPRFDAAKKRSSIKQRLYPFDIHSLTR